MKLATRLTSIKVVFNIFAKCMFLTSVLCNFCRNFQIDFKFQKYYHGGHVSSNYKNNLLYYLYIN